MQRENRKDDRYPVALEISLSGPQGLVKGRTVDLSLGGLRMRTAGAPPMPQAAVRTTLNFPAGGTSDGHARVVWTTGQECGLAFTGPTPSKVLAFAHVAARHAGH